MKRTLMAILVGGVVASAQCGQLTPEEQALMDRHMIVEVHLSEQPSGHKIVVIKGPKGSGPVLMFNFGREDDEIARKAGLEMASKGYPPQSAVNGLLVEARRRYPNSPFFVRCFMNEAANAYNSRK
jgi:hypothetical protein